MKRIGLRLQTVINGLGLVLVVLAVSGCQGLKEFRDSMNGAGTHIVAAPKFELPNELKETKLPRVKVSAIEVKATKSGTVFMRKSAARINYGFRHDFGAEYILGNGFEAVVRDAMDHIFEIDPKAGQRASVNAAVSVSAAADSNWWCKFWDTRTRVEFDITVTPQAGQTISQNFSKNVSETFCAVQFLFPSIGGINANFETAFGEVAIQAFDYFRLMKRASPEKPTS